MKIVWFLCTVLWLLHCTAADAEQRMSISAAEANIRSSPNANADVLWKAEKYFPISVIKKTGEWYNFKDSEGDEGWVHQSLVGTAPCVITIKEKCNLRSEPKNDAKILFSVGPGIPFKVVKKDNKWLLVEHKDGDKGWIHDSLVW